MAAGKLAHEIDRLYQLPLSEFTGARNALAKSGGAEVRALAKPTLPAWAVNQLYWKDRATYDALVEAASTQRRTHHAVLAGRKGDLRAAGKTHDAAVEAALKAALGIVKADGHPITEATRQGILNTLRALPADDPPGRLTRTLQPGGFEMLAGLQLGAAAKEVSKPAPPKPARGAGKKTEPKKGPDRQALARARAGVEAAERKVRDAEQAARREEFDAARATREAEKAERAVVDRRTAFEEAREALEEAEAAVAALARARDAATRRADQASGAVEKARATLEEAQARLAALDD